jgi:RTX calcium-binding nonapeptide repeat (4 copies)/Divergent InlB B-repeat domain
VTRAPLAALLAGLALAPTAAAEPRTVPGAEECAGAPCVVVVDKKGGGFGIVTSTPAGIACGDVCWMTTDFDERVTLAAAPSAGSVFTGWSGECAIDAANRCHLVMDISKEVTAVFDLEGAPPTPLVDVLVPTAPAAEPGPVVAPPPGCTIGGTAGDDLIYGTLGDDVICALAGDDHIHGGGGHDVVRAGPGHDEIEGQAGDDRISAGTGRDAVDGGTGSDRIAGGPGADVIRAGAGADVVLARDGFVDLVAGGAGRDAARADRRDRLRSIEKRL